MKKSAKIWLWAGLAIAAGLFGVYRLVNSPGGVGGPAAAVYPEIFEIKEDDWFKGGENARAVLIEYSDFQCPACAAYAPLLEQLNEEFGNDLKIVYRHFPLLEIHKNAVLAAQAAEAAGQQEKFWEMHDLIFGNQKEWERSLNPEEIFKGYAIGLGLDEEEFVRDLNSKETEERVERDLKEALKLGLTYTPTFILNGKKIENPRSYGEFRELVSQIIAD